MGITLSQSRLQPLQTNPKPMRLDVADCSEHGRIRPTTEDSHHVSPEKKLFVLSDGMGGAAKGEVASAIAVKVVAAAFEENEEKAGRAMPRESEANPEFSDETNSLVCAVRLANRQILEEGQRDPASTGMGATIVAARIRSSLLSLAHVGDSRAYLFRARTLQQLTCDHSLGAEPIRQGVMTHHQAAANELKND